MIESILNDIRKQNISIGRWVLGFLSILFVRFIFESISSPTTSGVIPSDPYTLVHYALFFLSLSLITIFIVGFFTKNYIESAKVMLFGLPLLWLAPIIDIIVSGGKGFKMLYLFDTGNKLIFDFFTFFGTSFTYGATIGMRVVIILSILGLAYYIFLQTKNISKAFLGGLLLYIAIFAVGSLPGIFYTLSHLTNPASTNSETVIYFEKIISQSTIAHNTLHDGASSVPYGRFIELGFDKLLSQILFILSCIFGILLFWKNSPEKFKAVLKNARPERVNFYTASLFCGIGFAYINDLGNKFTFIDLFGFLSLIIAWVALWMNAVHTNDIADIEIDKISNKNRPLVKKELTENEMRETGYIWLAIALLGAWCAGFYPFFMALVYVACSYIYSTPPLRLRKFPLVPSFLIAVACLSTILAGFFFVSVHKEIQTFPAFLAIGIVIIVSLAINFKDIKDIEGDKVNGIVTIPTLYGEKGIKIVGLMMALSILLVPIFLSFYLLYIVAVPCAFISYKLVTKKPYKEKPIFVLRFIFLACIALSYLAAYWFVHGI